MCATMQQSDNAERAGVSRAVFLSHTSRRGVKFSSARGGGLGRGGARSAARRGVRRVSAWGEGAGARGLQCGVLTATSPPHSVLCYWRALGLRKNGKVLLRLDGQYEGPDGTTKVQACCGCVLCTPLLVLLVTFPPHIGPWLALKPQSHFRDYSRAAPHAQFRVSCTWLCLSGTFHDAEAVSCCEAP